MFRSLIKIYDEQNKILYYEFKIRWAERRLTMLGRWARPVNEFRPKSLSLPNLLRQ